MITHTGAPHVVRWVAAPGVRRTRCTGGPDGTPRSMNAGGSLRATVRQGELIE